MEAKKDIGKAFREKLDSLDRQPNDALWGAISQSLDEKDKKKKFPFFWLYIISCTVISITAIAIVLSNLAGSNKNNIDIKPDGIENKISAGSSVTNESSASEKNSAKGARQSNKLSTGDNVSTKSSSSASIDKNAEIKNNTGGSVATSIQKNKTSQTKKIQSNAQHNSAEAESYATGNTQNSRTKNRKQSKTGAATIASATQTAGNSNSKQSQSYAQTGTKNATSSGNTKLSDDLENYHNKSDSNVSQTGNKTTSATATINVEPASDDNNTSASGKENTTSAIDTKTIGELNTLTVADSTKTVIDSLKTPIADTKEDEKKEHKKDSIPPVPHKKFNIYAYGGPSYFTFPDRTIVTDSTTSGINTKSTTRFGIMFGYSFTNKLSVRAGVSSYKLKQSASGIKLNYAMSGGSSTDPAQLIPTPDFTWIDYQQPFGTNSGVIISTLGENYQAIINIDRELSYVEIPLELGYNLLDKRFGVDIFAGGSMLLLNKNKVTAYNEKGQMYLGEWNAAEKTSFTGTLGLGLHYKFTPSLQLNAEPVFNYYFNTYKDSKPYSFTFRLGIQYNFDF